MRIILIMLLLVPVRVFTQDISRQQDAAAEPVLQKLSADFNQEKAYQVEFKYEVYSSMEDAKVSDYGSVIVEGPNYKLKTEDTEVYYNGKYLWTYNILNEEVYKSEPVESSQDQLLVVPFRVFTEYKKYFKYQYKGESELGGAKLNETELYPVDLNSGITMIELYTQKKSHELFAIAIKQKDGLILTIFIQEIIRNIKVSDDTFTWNESTHPDVLLIEM